MLRIIKISVYFFTLLIVLIGCGYNLSEENFLAIEPPGDLQYFDLNLLPSGDTIKVYDKANLNFSFNTNGLEVLATVITLQDRRWEFYSSNGYVALNPLENTYTQDTLTLSIYLKSGSGSIADHAGMEGYFLEKKWLVIQDTRPAPKIILTKSINEDGFLKIEWPRCDRYNFVQYEVGGSNPYNIFHKDIKDATRNYFIDSTYVGGDYNIRVSCRLENSHTWGESLKFREEPPQMSIVELGYDSLRISWNKSPYNAKYRLDLTRNNILYFDANDDTTCTMPQFGFGQAKKISLCTRSKIQSWQEPNYYWQIASDYTYSLGTRIISANWPDFAYNAHEKVLYSNEYDHMYCYNIDDYSQVNTTDISRLLYAGLYSCPTNSSKVGVLSEYKIYIFNDKGLSDPTIVPGPSDADHFLLSDNDIVAYAYDYYYKQFDVKTGRIRVEINIPDYPYYSKWACITTSQDANYMCTVTRNGLKLYDINNEGEKEIYTDSRSYRSACFNPLKPDELYLTLVEEKGIEIRNPKDFSLINRIDIPMEMVIRNIDPETGNVLVTDYEYVYIVDTTTHEILLKVPCDESKIWLFNNNLFTNTGFGLNVLENL